MPRLRVIANSLNIRKKPDITSPSIGVLQKGEAVTLLETSNDGYWLNIEALDGRNGWCAHKYLSVISPDAEVEEFPWMAIALRELGVSEIAGPKNNPRILEYLKSAALNADEPVSDSSTAWCSGFVNWCMEKAGFAGTDSLWARSWAKWGQELDEPRRGCIVVFKRKCDPSDKKKTCGHVAFYVAETANGNLEVRGGNQGNMVCFSDKFPKSDVLSYRLPS